MQPMRKAVWLLLAVTLIAAGCSNPGAKLVGHWTLDSAWFVAHNNPRLAKEVHDYEGTPLDFKPDGTFDWTVFKGTYTLKGDYVTLHATSGAFGAMDETISAKLSSDGSRLTTVGGSPTVYRRS